MSDKEVGLVDLTDIWTKTKTAGPETKQFPALLSIKSIDKKARRITAIASTGNIDRDNEIIEPEAFRESLPIFMKNPVVLAAHQHRLSDGRSPVVANVVSASVTPAGVEVIIEFHSITPLAEEYWQLYSTKVQKALSIGYISLEGSYEQRNSKSVFVHTKIEWIELSLCPVGSNRDSLTRAKQRKLDFVNDKKILAEIMAEVPDFDEKCEEFAEAILGLDDIEMGLDDVEDKEFDSDFFDIDNDTDADEYSELFCKQEVSLENFSF